MNDQFTIMSTIINVATLFADIAAAWFCSMGIAHYKYHNPRLVGVLIAVWIACVGGVVIEIAQIIPSTPEVAYLRMQLAQTRSLADAFALIMVAKAFILMRKDKES